MGIKLKYFQKKSNVGDAFSKVVASRYISSDIQGFGAEVLNSPNLLLIGSIAEWADSFSHICGSGLISSRSKLSHQPKKINCVRGPLTAFFLEKQGITVTRNYGDPGLLISKFYSMESSPQHKIGIIPHYLDADSAWIDYCRNLGIHVLDVLSPLDNFVKELQMCDVIYSSSLHGIIFAHSFGKRALWVDISDKVIGNGFKFYDYYLSVGVSPECVNRIKINPETDPYSLLSFADSVQINDVLAEIEVALNITKEQLINEY